MIPAFLSGFANYAVLILGVWLTMEGKFTLGAVMMFQGFLSSFMSPAMTLVGAGQTIQEMRTQMERVEDVMEYPKDENVDALNQHPDASPEELVRTVRDAVGQFRGDAAQFDDITMLCFRLKGE